MDQLHEELKEPVVELPGITSISPTNQEEFDGMQSDSGIPISEESSQSDGDYETCESGPNSEKDSCADETIDASDAPQESSDIMIPTSLLLSSADNNQNAYVSGSNNENFTGQIDSFSVNGAGDPCFEYDKQKRTCVTPECPSHASNSDSALTNENSFSGCDKSDSPLLKEDSKSNVEAYLSEDSNNIDAKGVKSFVSDKHCNHSPFVAMKHMSCNKGTSAIDQTSQIKNIASQAIINSMLTAKKKKTVQHRSIISDIFDGKILSSVQCLTCDTVS